MPKVHSSKSGKTMTASAAAVLHTYYCICGEFVLVSETALDKLPRRPVDGAYVLRNRDAASDKKKTAYKLNSIADKIPIIVKRPQGLEKIWKTKCTRCELQIGYETQDPKLVREKGSKYQSDYSYIVDGALTKVQSTMPPRAFEERVGCFGLASGSDKDQAPAQAQALVPNVPETSS